MYTSETSDFCLFLLYSIVEKLLYNFFALKCLHSGTIPGRGRGHALVQGHAGEAAGHDHDPGRGHAPAGGTLDQGEYYTSTNFIPNFGFFKIFLIQGMLISSELGIYNQ